jgi:alpha-tubulin suppressor-like RCC1 family protein
LPYTAYTLSLDTTPYELKPETEGTVNVIYEDITHDIIIFARKILSISTGNSSSYIIKEDGTSWGTGYNRYGELGLEIEE